MSSPNLASRSQSSLGHRPVSRQSTTRPLSSLSNYGRPLSRASQYRPPSRASKLNQARLLPLCESLVECLSDTRRNATREVEGSVTDGLDVPEDPLDEQLERQGQKALAETVALNLEKTTLNKAAVTIDLKTAENIIQGLVLLFRLDSNYELNQRPLRCRIID
jgi:hypothetical protein